MKTVFDKLTKAKKKPVVLVQVRIDENLYDDLRDHLKKHHITLKMFFEVSAKDYLRQANWADKKKLLWILPLLLTAGCATGYHADDIRGGFDSTELGSGKYMVTFDGNRYTSNMTAEKYAIRRAQELCSEQMKEFDIIESHNGGGTAKVIVQCKTK